MKGLDVLSVGPGAASGSPPGGGQLHGAPARWRTMRPTLLLAACAACLLVWGAPARSGAQVPQELGVMTFNIRGGTAGDREHAWPHRKLGQHRSGGVPTEVARDVGEALEVRRREVG